MTTEEFSNQLDTLLDSHKIVDEFGKTDNYIRIKLDEYEKSVLLTEAQDLLLREHFTSGFDSSEQGQMYYSSLITVGKGIAAPLEKGYTEEGKIFDLPKDIFWILNERITDDSNNRYVIKPINYSEYDRIQSKPYAKPFKRQAWRLYQTNLPGDTSPKAEIILRVDNEVTDYSIRYIKQPSPIILENIGDLSIRGISVKTECELNSLVHFDILSRAVQIALSRYAPTPEENTN